MQKVAGSNPVAPTKFLSCLVAPLAFSIFELKKAVANLEKALNEPKNEFLRDSVIQRFEFCVELAWKTSKKAMGTSTTAPKDVIREMAQSRYIVDVDIWLRSIDMRNLSSHTYKEEVAESVYAFAKSFLGPLQALCRLLEGK